MQKYDPSTIDLFVIYGVVDSHDKLFDTVRSSIPVKINRTNSPEMLSYRNLYDAVVKLEKKFGLRT